ncbi:MAG: DUF4861 family protein [Bacteroidales bacterium]|nr:DUF4861 family protein [Candidatus Liminaster caballi]
MLYTAAGLMLAACSPKNTSIEVVNPLPFDRNAELVSAPVSSANLGKLVDADGNEVAYQVKGDEILFQASVPAVSTATYTMLASEPASEVEPLTTAFFLGDRRKDDFCWENDKAAYRMYGPALLPENPSSGVDLWLKHSSQLAADAMYRQEEGGKPYHVDYGLGIDSYKVGHAAGCGGVAIYTADGQIWPGGPFKTWEILQEGPLQTIFRLTYDSVQVADKVWNEVITITVNAGAQVNKAEVCFTGEPVEGAMIGGAYFHHDDPSVDLSEKVNDYQIIACAEPATSDKGIYRVHEQMGIDATTLDFGRNYVAVIVPGAEATGVAGATEYAVKNYEMGQTVTYYFGGGWSKRDYATDDEWFNATRQTAASIATPLIVKVK